MGTNTNPNQPRVKAGLKGGEWTSAPAGPPAAKPLGGPAPLRRQFGTAPEPTGMDRADPPAPAATGTRGVWSIADASIERLPSADPNVRSAAIHIGGRPDRRQRGNAAAAMYRDTQDDTAGVRRRLLESAAAAKPMTALTAGRDGSARAIEGRGFTDSEGGLCLMLKGSRTKGYRLDGPDALPVLDFAPGYNGQGALAEAYHAAAALVPRVEPARFDGIPEYDSGSGGGEPPDGIAAVFLVDGPDLSGDGPVAGSLFLATDIQSEDGIVNGYGWFPAGSQLTSEHGSMRTADIARRGGRVLGYEPGSIGFGDCLRGGLPPSRAEAYRAVQGQAFYDE